MTECLKYSLADMSADDSRILSEISCVSDTFLLQEDLHSIIKWPEENNMELHRSKFQYITHCLPFSKEYNLYVTAKGQILEPLEDVLDLGVNISADLSWS